MLTRLQVGCLLLPLSRGHLRSGRETEVLPVWTVAGVCRLWVLPSSGQGDKRHGQAEGSTLSSRGSREEAGSVVVRMWHSTSDKGLVTGHQFSVSATADGKPKAAVYT